MMKTHTNKVKVVIGTLMIILAATLFIFTDNAKAAVRQTRTRATIGVGETVTLYTGSKNRSNWICNNTRVATVNKNTGKVKGISAGSAMVRAYVNDKIYTFQITVDAPRLNTEEVVLKIGETFDLEVNNTEREFKFSSRDEDITEVDESGTISAIDLGETDIIVYNGKTELLCKVIVTDDFFETNDECPYKIEDSTIYSNDFESEYTDSDFMEWQ